jgi:outer membrane protein TolC
MLDEILTIGRRAALVMVIATALTACAARSPFDDRGPPAPDAPFQDPALEPIERTLREMQTHPAASGQHPDVADSSAPPAVPAAPTIDPDHAYTLAELIDIAERNHPVTRAVWERARQAALAIGLVDGAYQPMLAASINAGYERAVFPIPTFPPVINDSNFSAQTADIVPGLQLSWLLYDFGRREAAENAARSGALAASASFNEQHQRVAQAVTDTYHAYLTAIDRTRTLRIAAKAAKSLEETTRARRENGMATETQLLAAIRGRTRADFDVEAAIAIEETARIDLIEAAGLAPKDRLTVALSDVPIDSPATAEEIGALVTRALERRPDMARAIADYRARQADVRLARAAWLPTVSLSANASIPTVSFNVEDTGWVETTQPWYGAMVGVSVPLLDGEIRDTKLQMALRGLGAASAEIAATRDRATREVWRAYAALTTAIRRRAVVSALMAASEKSFEQSMAAFQNGLATFLEVDEARRGLADAQLADQASAADVRVALSRLATATGDLLRKPAAVPPLALDPRPSGPAGLKMP